MSAQGGPLGGSVARAKALAFYLPQYHPIPENDRWWGPGFTEWTKVTRARPLSAGHYQPHEPGQLGYYDLRVPEVRDAQATLAREHGLGGFIYYHYWFHGKRLLQRPFDEVLASGSPDFPFALCWANEEWTRNWDGQSGHVLMPQEYSDQDDRDHIRWLLTAFSDDRYLKIDGRPLLLVYHPTDLPHPRRTTDLWRTEAQRHGFPDLFLAWTEGWGPPAGGPESFGFDASVGFMPPNPPRLHHPGAGMGAHQVFDYVAAYESVLQTPGPPWRRFPSVMVGWDNTARRPGAATLFEGATPEAYGDWLARTVASIEHLPEEERLLVILAWNEWAEGNHLEPDQKFGRAFLEVTRSVLTGTGPPDRPPAAPSGERPAVGAVRGPIEPDTPAGTTVDKNRTEMPVGPWVLVFGMHRSATSALTGALGALGFNMPSPDDRLDWPESNLEHWESRALTVFDDDLLEQLGGSWDAPPDLSEGWERDLALPGMPDPVSPVLTAFPEPGPLVWKDPRLCLLYPYWRPLLPGPIAAVHLWRSPMAVARSLHSRDGMDLPLGAALWERYNRSALEHLRGVDCYIADYQDLLDEPRRFIESLAEWLGALPQFVGSAGQWDLDGAVASLGEPSPRRPADDDGLLLDEQRQLVELLTARRGGHRPLLLGELGAESTWTTALLRARREYSSRELDTVRSSLDDALERNRRDVEGWSRLVDGMTHSTSWRVTAPLRSVVTRLQRARRPGTRPDRD